LIPFVETKKARPRLGPRLGFYIYFHCNNPEQVIAPHFGGLYLPCLP
jgi:hypothetical protein